MTPRASQDHRPAESRHVRGTARLLRALAVGAMLAVIMPSAPVAAGTLTSETEAALRTSPYAYIATQRKDGTFGTPAEIWFMYRDGAVWVASPPATWRAKRIHAGRPAARIAVGRRDGPSFRAIGSIVKDPAMYTALCDAYAEKYKDGWARWAERFRTGLADGSRVLIKYTPQ
jgi:hypothetical protein